MAKKQADVVVYDIESFENCFTVTWKSLNGEPEYCVVWRDTRQNLVKLLDMFENAEDTFFVGYNSMEFDDQVITHMLKHRESLLKHSNEDLTQSLFNFVQRVINDDFKKYKYSAPFQRIDVQRVANLRKSLKMVAINLKWPLIFEFGKSWTDRINSPEEIEELLAYNLNDVEITEEFFKEIKEDINLRAFMSAKYGVDVISKPEQKVADVVLRKLYEEKTGVPDRVFSQRRTQRMNKIDFGEIIDPSISFHNENLQDLLSDLKDTELDVFARGNEGYESADFERHVTVGNMVYKVAKGGLHSENEPEFLESTEDVKLIDADVTSFYPYIAFTKNVYPEHLGEDFVDLLEEITKLRVEYKYSDEEGSDRNSDVLKIVINATYGKFGDPYSWLFDLLAMYSVTINGQLELLRLIDMLEYNGFEVVYANTDGVTAKVPKNRMDEYNEILEEWEDATDMILDKDHFSKMAIADVNNYIVEFENGYVKRKGRMNKNRHKGKFGIGRSFHSPVVPMAAEEYLLNNKPIPETIAEHDDIYDFCQAQRPGRKFDIYYQWIEDGKVKEKEVQRSNRYFIARKGRGGQLLKRTEEKELRMVAGEDVVLLNEAPEDEEMLREVVDDRYYIQEARKLVIPIKNNQLSLI